MSTARPDGSLEREVQELRSRLREAEEALRAIREGEVDALVVEGPEGPRAQPLGEATHPYRVLVEQMRDAALILSGDGVVLYCNGRLSDLLGMPRKALVGGRLREIAVPEDRARIGTIVERGRSEPLAEEFRLQPAPGSGASDPIPIRIVASPLSTDRIEGICVVATDLTDVKRRERLETQERLTRGIVEYAATAIVVLDGEGHVTRMNSQAADLLGRNAGRVRFQDLLSLPESLEEMAAQSGVREVTVEAEGGERSLLLGIREPGEDLAAMEARWIVTLLDVTERRKAEERLRFQAQLLETVGEAVIATDPEGRVIYWNSGAEEVYGWSAEEAAGRGIMELTVAPESRDRADEIMEALVRGESYSGEFLLRRRDGSTFVGAVTDSPIYDRDGRLAGVVGISRDVSEIKGMEQELRQTQKLRAIGQLAGGVAHDFNNVLTAIQGHTELLLERVEENHPMRGDLEEVAANAERAARLTDQLLAFSRQQMLRPEVLDLGEVMEETESFLRRLIVGCWSL